MVYASRITLVHVTLAFKEINVIDQRKKVMSSFVVVGGGVVAAAAVVAIVVVAVVVVVDLSLKIVLLLMWFL
jgi:hypothetical protein